MEIRLQYCCRILLEKKVLRGKNRKNNELFLCVTIGVIFVITLFGCINIYNSCKIINKQADSNLIYLTENIRQRENSYFHEAEEAVENSKKTIELTINERELNKIAPIAYKYNKYKIPYIENYFNSIMAPLLLSSVNNVDGLVSVYFVFDPKFLMHKSVIGLWYSDSELRGNFELTDNGPTVTMYPESRPDLQWFYVPEKLKKGEWGEPYMDSDIKIEMITYSAPVYSGKKFLGVIGVDMSMDEIKKFICKFKIYETGKAYLIDQNNKIIFAKDDKALTSAKVIDENLYTFLGKAGLKEGIKLDEKEITLIKSSSSDKLFAVTRLYNGFILVLEVPANELYAETIKLINFTSYLLVLTVLVSLLIALEAQNNIKKINDELMHKEKLISLGTIVAEIAHEINNPVAFLSSNLDTLKNFLGKIKMFMCSCESEFDKVIANEITIEQEIESIHKLRQGAKIDYVLESLDEIIDESKEGIKRVSEIVFNLKNFAKDDSQEVKSSEDLEKLIEESLSFLNGKIKSGIEVIKNFEEIPPLLCSKNQLEQVFINLLDNARYSVEKKGHADKKITISIYKKGKNACIEISDNGVGIENNKINRIFDPFFTTKGHGEGTGLGLSIAYEIITKKHKGKISVESKRGIGTKFIIKIPY